MGRPGDLCWDGCGASVYKDWSGDGVDLDPGDHRGQLGTRTGLEPGDTGANLMWKVIREDLVLGSIVKLQASLILLSHTQCVSQHVELFGLKERVAVPLPDMKLSFLTSFM